MTMYIALLKTANYGTLTFAAGRLLPYGQSLLYVDKDHHDAQIWLLCKSRRALDKFLIDAADDSRVNFTVDLFPTIPPEFLAYSWITVPYSQLLTNLKFERLLKQEYHLKKALIRFKDGEYSYIVGHDQANYLITVMNHLQSRKIIGRFTMENPFSLNNALEGQDFSHKLLGPNN